MIAKKKKFVFSGEPKELSVRMRQKKRKQRKRIAFGSLKINNILRNGCDLVLFIIDFLTRQKSLECGEARKSRILEIMPFYVSGDFL